MKEIYAIIRRNRLAATRYELQRAGVEGYSFFPAFGRGRQRGLKSANGSDGGHGFLPRMLFYIVVEENQIQETVEAIMRANQTGEFGDGRVFILSLESANRMSDKTPKMKTEEVLCAGVC